MWRDGDTFCHRRRVISSTQSATRRCVHDIVYGQYGIHLRGSKSSPLFTDIYTANRYVEVSGLFLAA